MADGNGATRNSDGAGGDLPERESMEYDVVVVGAGCAGLSTAIKLKQLAPDLSVVVLEKGAEVGAHVLSGCVLDPVGLDALLPDWRDDADCPVRQPVTKDKFLYLGPASSLTLPSFGLPRILHNERNFIVSLANVTRWLGAKAEEMGVEIYPGFAAAEVLHDENGAVIGVATGDMGITRSGEHGPSYQRGMALLGRYTVFAEGVRGSLTKSMIERFGLDAECEPQKYGLGIKEIWEVRPEVHQPGLVLHTMGWPLDNSTGGGSFLYHMEDGQVAVGFVVHLNYRNPYLSPFEEFQRFKTHHDIRPTFEGGKRLAYGARAINEGGWQSVPRLSFPGGVLVGCSAGFVNVPRIKGSHNAMLSGVLAAEHLSAALAEDRRHDEVTSYEESWRGSEIGRDLWAVRNAKPLWSKLGTFLGITMGGVDMWSHQLFGRSLIGTMHHGVRDCEATDPAAEHKPIAYPKPDGEITFDKLSSVYLSNTNHEEDQPSHLKLADPQLQLDSELKVYAGLSQRYCPAGVYEWETEGEGAPRFVINAQNCVHCKTCDIKDPNQNIVWHVPQGGEGPVYPNM